MEVQLNPNDVIDAITAQRNAALDEIARQAAIIRTLQKMLEPQGLPGESGNSGVPVPLAPIVESRSQP